MKAPIRFLLFLAAAVLLPSDAAAQGSSEVTIYAPKAGRFGVQLPAAWQRVPRPREGADSMTLEPASGKAALVLFFYPQPKEGLPTDEAVEQMARKLCEPFLSTMVEQAPVFTALESKNGKAVQTTLTDKKLLEVKKPKKGDFRFLTHGLLVLGNRMVMFGILHNDKDGPDLQTGLRLIAEGVQLR